MELAIRTTSNHRLPVTSLVDKEHQALIDAMPPYKKMERAAEMFHWARQAIGRQILSEEGDMSPERLKLKVALRQYGNEPEVVKLIERRLRDVPH